MANAYITNDYSTGQVAVLNTLTNTVGATISVANTPIGIALSPDGKYAYTANENNNTVGIINLTTATPSVSYVSLPSGAIPQRLAVSPDGSQVWVANQGNNTVSIISGGGVAHTLSLSAQPGYIAFTPDGNYAYVPIGNGTVNIYSTGSSPSLAYTVSLSYLNVHGVAISADGSYAYVANFDGSGHNYLVVISTSGTPSIYTSIAVGNIPWGVAVRPNASEVYVVNDGDGTVSVIDTATNTVTATIGVAAANNGTDVAFTSDGAIAYVALVSAGIVKAINASTHNVTSVTVNSYPGVYTFGVAVAAAAPTSFASAYITDSGTNNVSVIDTTDYVVASTITVGTEPFGVTVSPDGAYAFVTNYSGGTVSVIDTATDTVTQTITVGTNPFGIAISPGGNNVYVANQGSNSISIISVPAFAVTTITTGVGNEPTGIAVTPDNAHFYVTNYSAGTVSVFNAATGVLVTTITVGTNPYGIAISSDGTKAFVANQGSNSVSVINTSTFAVTTITTGVGSEPTGVSVSPDGTTLWVTNYSSGTVSVFNTSTNALITTVTVGTNPYGVSFTPDGVFVYVVNYGSNTVSIINTSTNTTYTIVTLSSGSNPVGFGQFIQPASIPMTTNYTAPQGRLTLTSNTPVMTADLTGATSVYYTPYQGNIVPIYDGANTQSYTFSQLTMALNTSNHLSGKLYDLFIFLNSGVVTIGAGPAWSSSTSRGTGAGTTQLQQTNGYEGNANIITLTNGSTSYSSIPAGEATYVGTVYMTANGQTGMACFPSAASGGTNNILGLWNAYNRVSITAQCLDSTVSWTYTSSTVRNANGSANNRISFIDGLGQSNFIGSYNQTVYNAAAGGYEIVGVGVNSTTSGGVFVSEGSGSTQNAVFAQHNSYPILGFNYIQALEAGDGTHAATFYGGGANLQLLSLQISM